MVSIFEDSGPAGASSAPDSSTLQSAKAGAFDIVICKALGRLSRSKATIEDLRLHGVAMSSTTNSHRRVLAVSRQT